jgi:hypothetical protein
VIDPAQNALYVVAKTREGAASPYTYVQRLHALNLSTGAEPTPAVVISGSVTGSSGTITFNSRLEAQRPALVLSGGNVYIAWASHGDYGSYHGWVMEYTGLGNAHPLVQTAVFNSTPSSTQGGIWMSGAAPAVDSAGYLYLTTGNGDFNDTTDAVPGPPLDDFSMSFLKLDRVTLGVVDYFTPSQWSGWSSADLDIASAGLTVLPDGSGPSGHPNTLVGADKQGHLWLIDRGTSTTETMGTFGSPDKVLQFLALPGVPSGCSTCVFSSPAYYNGSVYMGWATGSVLALPLTSGLFGVSASTLSYTSFTVHFTTAGQSTTETYGYPSPTPVISGSPSGNALVWVLDNHANGTGSNGSNGASGPAILRAYNASTLGAALYSSSALAADAAGNAIKFTLPVVANGHVYVGGQGTLTVYGLAP